MNELDVIRLGDRGSECVLHPALGGGIVNWAVNGQNMLRNGGRDQPGSLSPLDLACFPLVPYSNRIGDARFTWDGEPVHVVPNFPPEPHAIHGTGWQASWTIEVVEADYCIIVMEHEANASWPWSFAASQKLELADGELRIFATATNRTDRPAPLSFGHHPYFDRQGASLNFSAKSVLMNGSDALPTKPLAPDGMYDFSKGSEVAERTIDHCYAGWNGHARISWTNRPLALEIESDLEAAVVYIPQDGAAFCFEPVPHVNNALNRPDLLPNIPVISPGATYQSTTIFRTKPVGGL